MAAAGIRTAVFLFVAAAVVGDTWQLWVAGVLFMVPQVLAVFAEPFSELLLLARALPEGLLEVVLMLFLLTGSAPSCSAPTPRSSSSTPFVLLALPGAALSVLHCFGRREGGGPPGWASRIAGIAVLAGGVLRAQGLLF